MSIPIPTKTLEWATNPTALITEPTLSHKNNGFVPLEKPSAQNFNWLLNIINQWLEWLKEGGAFGSNATNVNDLKNIDVTTIVDKSLAYINDYGMYQYNISNTQTEDSETVIQPNIGLGRWLLILPHPNFIIAYSEARQSELEEDNQIMKNEILQLISRVKELENN
jgi:hypothetical protein